MPKRQVDSAHILFLYSDTGGGHRSAAEAIIEALHLEYGEHVSTEMLDIFKEYSPFPFRHLPDLYPLMVKVPPAWGMGYRLTNGEKRAQLITKTTWPYVRRSVYQLVRKISTDLIVSVHPVAVTPVLRALGSNRPPFITVVTDLASTHALWYNPATDLCIVPTEQAYQQAIAFGLSPHQVQIIGLPVSDRFCQPPGKKAQLRQAFGWPEDRPLLLMVGGGEGMGPIPKIAEALAQSCPETSLAIVCGRNKKLKQQLEAKAWPMPTFVYGFVHEMPEFMRAADILITKAGPGTISESLIAGLPMILFSRLPGQEDGNVPYVVSQGAGIWAPNTQDIVHAVQYWLNNLTAYRKAQDACRRLARPQAARKIAHLLVEQINLSKN